MGPSLTMPDNSAKESVVLSCKDLRDVYLVFPVRGATPPPFLLVTPTHAAACSIQDGATMKKVLRGLKSVMSPAHVQDLFAFATREDYKCDDDAGMWKQAPPPRISVAATATLASGWPSESSPRTHPRFSPLPDERWDWLLYSTENEFARLQLAKEEWRIPHSNEVNPPPQRVFTTHSLLTLVSVSLLGLIRVLQGYAVCPTYPRRFIVPAAVSDADLVQSAEMRHQGYATPRARPRQPFIA